MKEYCDLTKKSNHGSILIAIEKLDRGVENISKIFFMGIGNI